MTPIQQLMLGVGAKKKTYIDDIFSTYLWAGSGSARAINNGINLSSKGGMVWIKNRTYSTNKHVINDTVRGHSNAIMADTDGANTTQAGLLDGFNSNGFDVSTDNFVNGSSQNYSSWSFAKQKGFFDVVTWTGNGSARTISHSLGCIPGIILVKRLDSADRWQMYHRSLGIDGRLYMNLDWAVSTSSSAWWNATLPTASVFSVGTDGGVNDNGGSYVAYLFAGGESPAATARSVEMDGTGDYFDTSTSSDYTFGTGDFTVESWIRIDEDYVAINNYPTILDARTDGSYTNFWVVYIHEDAKNIRFYNAGADRITSNVKIERGEWYHIAVVRNSGVTQFYVNGTSQGTYSDSTNYSNTSFRFGANAVNAGYTYDGAFSNLRVVKGTAVYTSSFKPPTAPLTNITNTKLLCFNDSSTTGTTVGTITANGNPTASTDSPFDDPAGFIFGDNEDQNVIKCGTYVGAGAAQDIYLGFEPQWFFVKCASDTSSWHMVDCMRGCVTGGNDSWFEFNTADAESSNNFFKVTSTGFSFENGTASSLNGSGEDFIYMAIRRPDGYCGKPAEAGTEVFSPAVSGGSSSAGGSGCFVPNFPIDFGMIRTSGSSHPWQTGARLMGTNYFPGTDQSNAQTAANNFSWDSNVGYVNGNFTGYHSWVWKRHTGFDTVAYTGNGTAGLQFSHSLNKIPEMIWIKNRSSDYHWIVYHKGLNGGTNPEQYALYLDTNDEEGAMNTFLNNTAPTATHVTLGTSFYNNKDDDEYLAMLFSSIDGISKCGYYTGNGSATERTITLGFQPRFIIIKGTTTNTRHWCVLDTTRGWGSGNEELLKLDLTNAQTSTFDIGAPTSNGFTLNTASNDFNENGSNFIYYAHA